MSKLFAALGLSVKNLAAYGNLRFTPRQIYYEVCRTIKQPKGLEFKTAAAIFGAGSLPAIALLRRKTSLAAGVFAASAVLTTSLALLRRTPHTLATPVLFDDFENELNGFLRFHPRPLGLLDKETNGGNLTESLPFDLPAYGLPRLLICQSTEIAQMLRANNFHLEAACAILSFDEAAPLASVFQQMLISAGDSSVYFLHDASLAAYSLISNLRERLNLPPSARLQVLGLRPTHAERLHLFVQQKNELFNSDALEATSVLSVEEKRWLLMGRCAEVSAVHPVRLLRVLRRLVLGLPAPERNWKILLPPRDLGFM